MKLTDLVEKAVEDFPRLCYLSETDILAVMSVNLGNLVPLLPIINKVFPAINLVRFTEIKPKNLTTISAATTDEEGMIIIYMYILWSCHSSSSTTGIQILFIKDCHGQQLALCIPLLLGKRPATEWMSGLEYAISYSLASTLNETYLSLPALLKGMEVLTELQCKNWERKVL